MQRIHPLRDTHPQFSVLKSQSFHEFRVENWKLASDGSGRKLEPHTELKLAAGVLLLAWWAQRFEGLVRYLGLLVGVWVLVQNAILSIVHETVVVFPPHGIQLETHRGFKGYILSSSRMFIPFTILRDLVINEGLYGWNVRYYMVAITQPTSENKVLRVAFPNLLPHFPILKEVFNEIQMYLPQHNHAQLQ